MGLFEDYGPLGARWGLGSRANCLLEQAEILLPVECTKNLQPVNCRIYCSLLTVEYIRPHSVMSDTPVDAFWAKNERERTDVLKCVYSYTCARADIPHHV